MVAASRELIWERLRNLGLGYWDALVSDSLALGMIQSNGPDGTPIRVNSSRHDFLKYPAGAYQGCSRGALFHSNQYRIEYYYPEYYRKYGQVIGISFVVVGDRHGAERTETDLNSAATTTYDSETSGTGLNAGFVGAV